MIRDGAQATAGPSDRIQILHVSGELDLATADGLAARGCDAFAHACLLLLDLSDLSFCDACGLSAFVRIANYADMTAGRCVLIAPQPQVVKLLQICRLNQRLPVFATVDDALANLTATAAPAHANKTQRSAKAGQVPMPTRRSWPGRHARCVRLLAAERAAADPVDAADAAHRGRQAARGRPAFLRVVPIALYRAVPPRWGTSSRRDDCIARAGRVTLPLAGTG